MDLQDYIDLIPPPNSIAPNYISWLTAWLQLYIDTQTALNDLVTQFDINLAVGDQLDIIGELLGLSRLVNFQPGGGLSAEMTDDQYRLVLQSKIILNQWDGTKAQIYEFWQTFFPQYPVIITDNQDMSMSVAVVGMPNDLTGTLSFGYDSAGEADGDTTLWGYDIGYWEPFNSLLRDLVLNNYFVPKPAGVSVSYTFIDDIAFGYDIDTDLMKGYDEGYWIDFN